jgi:hypothetical protein
MRVRLGQEGAARDSTRQPFRRTEALRSKMPVTAHHVGLQEQVWKA